jgi:hypothetical protein
MKKNTEEVSADTQILCFDDVRKHFDFERLFSAVTVGTNGNS